MRRQIVLVASALALLAFVPAAASAGSRDKSQAEYRESQAEQRSHARRPASVAQNGLCQRDTGTATSSLNFRNECDMREFWARMDRRYR